MTPEITPVDLELRLFISYSHADTAFFDRLVHDLRARGVRILVDQDEVRAGDSIRRRLEAVMESTDVFLIAISPDGVSSGWVNEEMDLILERTIAIPSPKPVEPRSRSRRSSSGTSPGPSISSGSKEPLSSWRKASSSTMRRCSGERREIGQPA